MWLWTRMVVSGRVLGEIRVRVRNAERGSGRGWCEREFGCEAECWCLGEINEGAFWNALVARAAADRKVRFYNARARQCGMRKHDTVTSKIACLRFWCSCLQTYPQLSHSNSDEVESVHEQSLLCLVRLGRAFKMCLANCAATRSRGRDSSQQCECTRDVQLQPSFPPSAVSVSANLDRRIWNALVGKAAAAAANGRPPRQPSHVRTRQCGMRRPPRHGPLLEGA